MSCSDLGDQSDGAKGGTGKGMMKGPLDCCCSTLALNTKGCSVVVVAATWGSVVNSKLTGQKATELTDLNKEMERCGRLNLVVYACTEIRTTGLRILAGASHERGRPMGTRSKK